LEQLFSKTHLNASESAINTFFYDVTKAENFDKKCLTLQKKNLKSPFKHFCFGRSKSSVKGLGIWNLLETCKTEKTTLFYNCLSVKYASKLLVKIKNGDSLTGTRKITTLKDQSRKSWILMLTASKPFSLSPYNIVHSKSTRGLVNLLLRKLHSHLISITNISS
jgi:hypothetical protein